MESKPSNFGNPREEVPWSHPFIERAIGTVRREYLDQEFFWNKHDLEKKLSEFSEYYNQARVHYALSGQTPDIRAENSRTERINLKKYTWKTYCNGRFSVPIPA
jgi:hypothetical protein